MKLFIFTQKRDKKRALFSIPEKQQEAVSEDRRRINIAFSNSDTLFSNLTLTFNLFVTKYKDGTKI